MLVLLTKLYNVLCFDRRRLHW